MLNFVFQKIKNKKWMVVCLLIGNLLMIATAAASPMYSQAVLQRVFRQELSDTLVRENQYPGTIEVKTSSLVFGQVKEEEIEAIRNALDAWTAEMEIPVLVTATKYQMENHFMEVVEDTQGMRDGVLVNLNGYSNVEDHVELIHGRMFSDKLNGQIIDVIVSERTFVEQGLSLDQVFRISRLTDADKNPYCVRISGVFKNKEAQDPYWLQSPTYSKKDLIMDAGLFEELFVFDRTWKQTGNVTWHAVMDHTKMRADHAEEMLEVIARREVEMEDLGVASTVYCQDTLESYVQEARKLNTTILVLQMPIFILLAVFIFMVSRQMLEMEQGEISVYKSRGASKWQIIRLYFIESGLIAGASFVLGIPLGAILCKFLGASSGFLEFVHRKSLALELGLGVWVSSLAAAVFSVATMVLPVIRYAGVGIVAYKRKKNRIHKRSLWKLLCVDLILLGLSLYGWYQFRQQEDFLAQQVTEGASLDPLLYFSSSLFMVGAGLLFLRLLPWIVNGIFRLGKRLWPPALYASFLRVLRANDNQGFLVVFLVLTVSMGIFSTQMARTINANEEERIYYTTGADLVLQERWASNSNDAEDVKEASKAGSVDIAYEEPDFGKYEQMDGVEKVTKVLVDSKVTASVESGEVEDVTVMGIHTKEFGEIAWFKDSLLPVHWYEYLNAISQNSRAILVSSNFREEYGCRIGDSMRFTNENGDSVRGIIYGFVDYWPSYAPMELVKDKDGVYKETEQYLVVAHLSQLQSDWGVTPYQVWIQTKGSTQFIYDYAQESQTKYVVFEDAAAQLVQLKNDPVFQGTNGILTIGFIIILLLCATGFLIYWILSIQSRTLQFGIFRAMGMSQKEVLSMLINEQIFISGGSIAAGVVVGIVASKLYVPLIQVAYSAANKVIPLELISRTGDYVRLGVVFGVMLILCMIVLGMLISRIKISQALKLGED